MVTDSRPGGQTRLTMVSGSVAQAAEDRSSAADTDGGQHVFVASDWKPVDKNTLRGFFTITLPSGLRIKECMLHVKNGNRWIGLPARPWKKQDGSTSYVDILDFDCSETRYRFQDLTLDALDQLLGQAAEV